jgi:mannose-1-phosphate guanylyltransferase
MKWVYVLFLCSLIGAKAEGMNVYGVILAGGVGERLWPLSRQEHPKQFLSIGSSENLLQQSINRFHGIIAPDAIWVVTSAAHAKYITEHMHSSVGNLIIEPCGRNTGPALVHACLELSKKDPNAIVVFAPADPYIPESDYPLYRRYICQAIAFASSCESIVLCGVKPTYAATGYGYIEYTTEHAHNPFFQVARFHEKPAYAIAQQYIQQTNMLWNIGTFVAKVSVFIDEFKRVAPDLFADLEQFHAGKKEYKDIVSQSVDCAVIERSNRVCVLPVDFSWCDVGNVDVFLSLKAQSGQHTQKEIIVESHNNIVDVPNKLVALIGVDDLCIIETADALLITKRSEAEKVRAVVAHLKREQQTEYL